MLLDLFDCILLTPERDAKWPQLTKTKSFSTLSTCEIYSANWIFSRNIETHDRNYGININQLVSPFDRLLQQISHKNANNWNIFIYFLFALTHFLDLNCLLDTFETVGFALSLFVPLLIFGLRPVNKSFNSFIGNLYSNWKFCFCWACE